MENMKEFKIYFFLGPPGSGKGTQIKMMANELGIYHFITSKVGGEYIKNHPEDARAQEQKTRFDSGLLWEAEWMFGVVSEKINELMNDPKISGVIFDGSPRTLFEAEHLYDLIVNKIGKDNLKIINLKIDETKLIDRIDKRIICSNGADHVFIRSEGIREGVPCPHGDGMLQKRHLDDPEIFKVRLNQYRQETVPGLDYLRTKHNVIDIDGDQPIEQVQVEILKKIK